MKREYFSKSSFLIAGLVSVLGLIFCLGVAHLAQAEELNTARVDTDRDGLFDFYERYVYGTSVTNADTDGDGYHDDTELANGYDPLNPTPGARYLPVFTSPSIRSGSLYVNGVTQLKGSVVADNTLDVADELRVYGPATFNTAVTVKGVINLQGTVYNQTAPVTIGDDLRVDGKTTLKELAVNNTATTKELKVDDKTTTKDLAVNNTATTKELKVDDKTTTKDLVVTNMMTVEDLTLGRGGKNRLALGTVSGSSQPTIVAGRKLATGEWTQVDEEGEIFLRPVPDAGTVYFPNGVSFVENPVITITFDFDGFKIKENGTEKSAYEVLIGNGKEQAEMSFLPYVESTISKNGKIVGFKYKILWLSTGASSDNYNDDITKYFPISWAAYGYEAK